MNDKNTLQVNALTVKYGNAIAVDGADLTVPGGKITALVGPNGAGKSSICLALYGAVGSTGSVFLGDRPLSSLTTLQRAKKGLALVPQGRQLFPHLTVHENLQVMAEMLELDPSDTKEALARYPILSDRRSQMAGVLSGGEQQMLAVTRALMLKPRVLILDEMRTGLAPMVVSSLIGLLRDLANEGTAVLLAEPTIGTLMGQIDRGYVLLRGRILSKHDASAPLDKSYRKAMGIVQQQISS